MNGLLVFFIVNLEINSSTKKNNDPAATTTTALFRGECITNFVLKQIIFNYLQATTIFIYNLVF